jgi:hypothetical protein
MPDIADNIKHSNLLTDVFGQWPSFHDAEVISMELFRDSGGADIPKLRARIHVFEMTPEVDEQGHYVLKNHVLVMFLFHGIVENNIQHFNEQNVLQELSIVDISSRQLEFLHFEVDFLSLFGVEAKFKCQSVEIEAVVHIDPPGRDGNPMQSPPKAGAYKTN